MNRDATLAQLRDSTAPWDFLIIGGGATGLGTAVDAAARGFRTLLLEQGDFAKATSSRSTKLIHGGVRYLRQGNLSLVRESLRERGLLLRNAPHLVHRFQFIVPSYTWWERPYYGIGLKLYDKLSGSLSLGPTRDLSAGETRRHLPTIEPSGLRGGVLYHDAQFDDSRLAIALAQTLADLGGLPLNYCAVTSLLKENARVCGVIARDLETSREFTIKARVVINATGVFTDAVRRLDDAQAPSLITLSQGAHLVLDKSFLPGDSALMVPKTDDGRVLFAIPWHDRVIVGTTDTPVREASLEPRPLAAEIEFLLAHAARYFAKDPVPSDILCAVAGLRPLLNAGRGRITSKLSREHALIVSSSGLITITGGKWTTYRRMAEQTVDQAIGTHGLEARPSRTRELRLHGAEEGHDSNQSVYGSDAAAVDELAKRDPALGVLLHPKLPYRACEVVWAARHEMARTVEDVLSRRTRALWLDARASMEAAPKAAALMANELGRDGKWEEQQVTVYRELAQRHLPQGTF